MQAAEEKKRENIYPGWEVPSHLYLGNTQCSRTANFLEDFFPSVCQILNAVNSCYDFNEQLIFSSEEREMEGGRMIMKLKPRGGRYQISALPHLLCYTLVCSAFLALF